MLDDHAGFEEYREATHHHTRVGECVSGVIMFEKPSARPPRTGGVVDVLETQTGAGEGTRTLCLGGRCSVAFTMQT